MVRLKPLGSQFVAVFGAALRDHPEAIPDLDPFNRVDTHHCLRDVGIQTSEHRFAQSWQHIFCDQIDARTDRITGTPQLVHEGFQCRHLHRIATEKWIGIDDGPVFEAQA